jgi:hypothetical protein
VTHAYKSDPSYGAVMASTPEWLFEIVALEARVDLLEAELRRLRDLVGEIDIAIIDEVLGVDE